jgi:hypothetical protein
VNSLYNKLAFNGYRIFVESPPDIRICRPGVRGILTYKDYDLDEIKQFEARLGYFPSPEYMAKFLAFAMTQDSPMTTRFIPAFVNDSNYNRIWTADWYQEGKPYAFVSAN